MLKIQLPVYMIKLIKYAKKLYSLVILFQIFSNKNYVTVNAKSMLMCIINGSDHIEIIDLMFYILSKCFHILYYILTI